MFWDERDEVKPELCAGTAEFGDEYGERLLVETETLVYDGRDVRVMVEVVDVDGTINEEFQFGASLRDLPCLGLTKPHRVSEINKLITVTVMSVILQPLPIFLNERSWRNAHSAAQQRTTS